MPENQVSEGKNEFQGEKSSFSIFSKIEFRPKRTKNKPGKIKNQYGLTFRFEIHIQICIFKLGQWPSGPYYLGGWSLVPFQVLHWY